LPAAQTYRIGPQMVKEFNSQRILVDGAFLHVVPIGGVFANLAALPPRY